MHLSMIALLLAGVLLAAAPASSQQPETGPETTRDGHPLRTPETGTRGPSGGSPETGYHGPRDVTKDAEPGKAKPAEELRRAGQTPSGQTPPGTHPTHPAKPIEGIRHGR